MAGGSKAGKGGDGELDRARKAKLVAKANGPGQAANAAGRTGKAAENAGKVGKVAGKVGKAAGKTGKAAGKVAKVAGKAGKVAKDAKAKKAGKAAGKGGTARQIEQAGTLLVPPSGAASPPIVVKVQVDLGGLVHGRADAPPDAAVETLSAPERRQPPEPSAALGHPAGTGSGRPVAVAGPAGEAGAQGISADGMPAWPVGPHYLRFVDGKGADAWARLKLKASGWYLEALEAAEQEVGLDRYVGVEMAIDGALASLLAGVDAAGYALLDEVERFVGPSQQRASVVAAGDDWPGALARAAAVGLELTSAMPVERALRPAGPAEPEGWLSQLRRLHRLAVRRNVLVRRPTIDDSRRNRLLDVPGAGPRPVTRYLHKARGRAETLVEQLLADVDRLQHERQEPEARPLGSRERSLPDLSARADVLGGHRRGPQLG